MGLWALVSGLRWSIARWSHRYQSLAAPLIFGPLFVVLIGAVVVPGPTRPAGPDWSDRIARDTTAWAHDNVEPRAAILSGWLYAWEIHARLEARNPVWLLPTLLLRTESGASDLAAVSTLFRFRPLTDTEAQRTIHDLDWLRFVPTSDGYVGLSLLDVAENTEAIDAAAIVLTGDSFQSTLDIAPTLDRSGGLSRRGIRHKPEWHHHLRRGRRHDRPAERAPALRQRADAASARG